MLVLARLKDERIFIGKDIIITIVEVSCGKVKIGIQAPRDVVILREEVAKAIQRDKARGAVPRQDERTDEERWRDGR